MSRRVIILILIGLIVAILAGTVLLIMRRLGSTDTASAPETSGGALLPQSQNSSLQGLDPNSDADGDGLSNGDEVRWGTNLSSPDSDGDGFKDGEEVRAGHNPTVAGPNDALPTGFEPGKNLNTQNSLQIADVINLTTPEPLPADFQPSTSPLQVDQYFQAGLDLSGGSVNLTEQYFTQYNTKTIDNSTVIPFVKAQAIVTKLPDTYETRIKKAAVETPGSLQHYIETVSSTKLLSDRAALEQEITILFQRGDSLAFTARVQALESYQNTLLNLAVPPGAVPLQRLLLGYTELLKATLTQISDWNADRVKALVALRQLDAADRLYYPLIQQEVSRLNQL